MPRDVELLIIGAGPFGLALAAYAQHLGIEYLIVGKPMDFWKSAMPQGMLLRSRCDWHLDAKEQHTIEEYLRTQALTPSEIEPLSRDFYLAYAQWFQEKKNLAIRPTLVHSLSITEEPSQGFQASLEDGETLRVANAVLAIGMGQFKNFPPELVQLLPPGRFSHTGDLVDFAGLKDKRCLIVGGRQSAFESAALIREAGAARIDLSYRHETPAFVESDWTWVNGLMDNMVENPEWYRQLSRSEREEANQRLWTEGRLQLEPWLWPRIDHESVTLWPRTQITECQEMPSGELTVTLDCGSQLVVDHILLATGYRVNSLDQVPLLTRGNLLPRVDTHRGFPVLDRHFQTNIPGLYFTSLTAARDFGPYLGFTISARASAKIIGHAIKTHR